MIETAHLMPLVLDAFSKKITWFELSQKYSLDEFIETFYSSRQAMQDTLEGLTDAQAAFVSPVHPFWSLSETVTHLTYSQGFYLNKLLDMATSQLPHVLEAARGFGEGAKQNIPAADLRQRLIEATAQIHFAIESTRRNYDPNKIQNFRPFGKCNYQTWVLLLLSHEMDHVRQATLVRRLALAEA